MGELLRQCVRATLGVAILAASALASAADPAQDARAAPGVQPEAHTAPAAQPAQNASPAPAGGGETPLYRVVDGNHVDANTMKGWRTWRAMACERCHGPNQEGLVGPSLVEGLKTQSKEDFKKCVLGGRVEKGMPNFGGTQSVVDNIDNLYAFLKGRSDDAIPTGHLKEIQ
jgi:mono/diheme cytochrome c family protein